MNQTNTINPLVMGADNNGQLSYVQGGLLNQVVPHPGFFEKIYSDQMRHALHMEEVALSHAQRMEIEHCKQHHAEKMLIIREDYKLARENKSMGIAVDSEGFLMIETKIELEDGSIKRKYRKLSNERNLNMQIIKGPRDDSVRFYIVEGSSLSPAVISDSSDAPRQLYRALLREGAIQDCFRRDRDLIISSLFGYLLRSAETIRLPDRFGWYREKDGEWRFCDENSMNLEDLQKGGCRGE